MKSPGGPDPVRVQIRNTDGIVQIYAVVSRLHKFLLEQLRRIFIYISRFIRQIGWDATTRG